MDSFTSPEARRRSRSSHAIQKTSAKLVAARNSLYDPPMGSTDARDFTPDVSVSGPTNETDADQELAAVLYPHLRRICEHALTRERRGHTLSPTALTHEAYLRLAREDPARWNDASHFLATAASVIRRVLIDYARARATDKRGGRLQRIDDTLLQLESREDSQRLIALSEALEELACNSPRQARLVELRFFGGLSFEQAGEALGISVATAKRDWDFARAWLLRSLSVE